MDSSVPSSHPALFGGQFGMPPMQVLQGGTLHVQGGSPHCLPPGGEQKYKRWKSSTLALCWSIPAISTMSAYHLSASGLCFPEPKDHCTGSRQSSFSGAPSQPHVLSAELAGCELCS